jgi:hypothetical protein
MKAKVTKKFEGVPDGKFYPESFNPGDVIEGDLAQSAIDAGNASPLSGKAAADEEDDDTPPPDRHKAQHAAPKNKGR